jgi:hypothetical protein
LGYRYIGPRLGAWLTNESNFVWTTTQADILTAAMNPAPGFYVRWMRARRLAPREPFDRLKHYGRTPNTAQKGFAGPGMHFDHTPPLVKHYYEGVKHGPGYMMTDQQRRAYAHSLGAGVPAPMGQRFGQGGTMHGYSMRMRKFWFGR